METRSIIERETESNNTYKKDSSQNKRILFTSSICTYLMSILALDMQRDLFQRYEQDPSFYSTC